MGIETFNHFWVIINNGGKKYNARIVDWDRSFDPGKITQLTGEEAPIPINITYDCPGCGYGVGKVEIESLKTDADGNQYVLLEDGCMHDDRRKERNCKVCPLSRQYFEENDIDLIDSEGSKSIQYGNGVELVDPIEEGLMQIFLHQ